MSRSTECHSALLSFRYPSHYYIGGKSIDDNLSPYHVVLTRKAKDRLRWSAKEKLSYTARRNVHTCVLLLRQRLSQITVKANATMPISIMGSDSLLFLEGRKNGNKRVCAVSILLS